MKLWIALPALLLSLPALAADTPAAPAPTPPSLTKPQLTPEAQQAEWNKRLQDAKNQHVQARAMKAEAKARFDTESKACFKEILVTACQQKARRTMLDQTMAARRLDNRAGIAERQVRKEQHAANEARARAEAPQREANMHQRETETSTEREKLAARQQKKLEHIEHQLQKGERQHSAREKRLQKKRAEHEKRVAEKMEKAKRREAEEAGN